MTPAGRPLAHSARTPGEAPQTYAAHIAGTSASEGVVAGARRRAEAMLRFHPHAARSEIIRDAVAAAATFHDLGKLDPEIQAALHRGRDARLRWDHVDAGVAHLSAHGAMMAAWIVRAHHAPGLPSCPVHFAGKHSRRLRGRRRDDVALDEHGAQTARTDRYLETMVEVHEAAVGLHAPARSEPLHGLPLRLGLSCVVDADHSDTAYADAGWVPPNAPRPRWRERLAALDAYVARLGRDGGQRDELRRKFYAACRACEPDQALMACEGPVGIGKTTAVAAYLLNRAIATDARRLFVVAPYTAILSQTARRLRAALVLDDERDQAEMIVAEHHHRADFTTVSSRDLATLWTAPIVLTTAVQFFETLAANAPSELRKLHALPGSVVFLDEAHAALPTRLWPQNWRWIRELAADWTCSFVLASGSLARFWEIDDIVGDARTELHELVPKNLVAPLQQAESERVHYVSAGHLEGPKALAERVASAPGPRLLIMNTVQSAAVMARLMRGGGHDVLHLSTALAPRDRGVILERVEARLKNAADDRDWTLVATSLMEAGVDLSFRTPFRERFATTSLIQIGGRGNRHAEWPGGATVHDFIVSHQGGLTRHPAAEVPADVLAELFEEGAFDNRRIDPAELVTLAMRKEIRRNNRDSTKMLLVAERDRCYPEVAEYGRVIDADTRLVVVDPTLRDRIVGREHVSVRELLSGSVQIWSRQIIKLGLDNNSLPGRDDIFWWPYAYDPAFLGYMEGALRLDEVARGDVVII